MAKANNTGILIAPNFALGAILMIKLACEAAKYFPNVDKKILFDEYERFSKENLKKYTTLYPDEISVLDELKKRYHLAICTSRRKDAAIACLKYFDLLKYFELIISVDDVSKPKPYPESLLKILDFFQNENDEVIYIGDAYTDYLCGLAANIDVGLVTYGMRKLPNDTCPDFEFKQFKEIGALLND